MGEYAEAAIRAAMNGRDPADMSPEDWDELCDDTSITADSIGRFVGMLLSDMATLTGDYDEPVSRAEALNTLIPQFSIASASALVDLLEEFSTAASAAEEGARDDA